MKNGKGIIAKEVSNNKGKGEMHKGKGKGFITADKVGQYRTITCIGTADTGGVDILMPQVVEK